MSSDFHRLQENWKVGQLCLIDICQGYCCEHISYVVKKNLEMLGLKFELNDEGEFRCNSHDKVTGLCKKYENRPSYCKNFFCPSVTRGFVRQVMIDRGLIKDESGEV